MKDENKDNLVYLIHIIETIKKIENFTNDGSRDDKTLHAVISCLEIIGEAVNNIAIDFRNKYDHIPWREAIDTRNVLIHDYFDVIPDIIWSIVEENLPQLKKDITEIIFKQNRNLL